MLRCGDRWTKPIEGALKCNVDASIFLNTIEYGMRAIIRDSVGSFIAARTSFKNGIIPLLKLKLELMLLWKLCRGRLTWALTMLFSNLIESKSYVMLFNGFIIWFHLECM